MKGKIRTTAAINHSRERGTQVAAASLPAVEQASSSAARTSHTRDVEDSVSRKLRHRFFAEGRNRSPSKAGYLTPRFKAPIRCDSAPTTRPHPCAGWCSPRNCSSPPPHGCRKTPHSPADCGVRRNANRPGHTRCCSDRSARGKRYYRSQTPPANYPRSARWDWKFRRHPHTRRTGWAGRPDFLLPCCKDAAVGQGVCAVQPYSGKFMPMPSVRMELYKPPLARVAGLVSAGQSITPFSAP